MGRKVYLAGLFARRVGRSSTAFTSPTSSNASRNTVLNTSFNSLQCFYTVYFIINPVDPRKMLLRACTIKCDVFFWRVV